MCIDRPRGASLLDRDEALGLCDLAEESSVLGAKSSTLTKVEETGGGYAGLRESKVFLATSPILSSIRDCTRINQAAHNDSG